MKIEIEKYRKPDGYATRYWAVLVDGELLAVTLYRRGAEAVARLLRSASPLAAAGVDNADRGDGRSR